MDHQRFDDLSRTLSRLPSRRDSLRALASVGLGLCALQLSDAVAGKHKKKKGKKRKAKKRNRTQNPPVDSPRPELPPLVFNQYGCIDVGQPCRGDSALCCSGICEGAAPAEGQPDTSRCVGHNAGGCTVDTNSCELNLLVECNPSNRFAICLRTTGNAGVCADVPNDFNTYCRVCTKDTDCQGEFGPGAACVVFDSACTAFCIPTGRTACVPAGI